MGTINQEDFSIYASDSGFVPEGEGETCRAVETYFFLRGAAMAAEAAGGTFDGKSPIEKTNILVDDHTACSARFRLRFPKYAHCYGIG